ncbi:hypothetical protein GGR54DRAFT_607936 [Hypoxylon sp. NC1633]|nr:hypothetical protein GGR54DRAFT_607936 [Hypoxylon sp. NC1633]
MQGDIFQMEQPAVQVHATQFEHRPLPLESKTNPQVAIYNEDDLSHLLYANHLHHSGHTDKVLVNLVHHDGYCTPLGFPPTGTQTPVSETNETPVFSDCESDFDEDFYLPSSPKAYRQSNPLKFEDGFEFPVFLGRQAEDSSASDRPARPSLSTSGPASELSLELKSQNKHVQMVSPEVHHVSEIDGPSMSWWPGPMELMEHEWLEEEVIQSNSSNLMPVHEHVSEIDGPLMSWWPAPLEMLEREWDEKFYE